MPPYIHSQRRGRRTFAQLTGHKSPAKVTHIATPSSVDCAKKKKRKITVNIFTDCLPASFCHNGKLLMEMQLSNVWSSPQVGSKLSAKFLQYRYHR